MLSSSVIKNVGQAGHYYSQQDNYYSKDEGIEQSEWWGKGAEKLSLSGQVETKVFNQLLQGLLPSGEQLGKQVEGQIKHRPGWDLTFSAPKSVSILALVGGDKRLLAAHRAAVTTTLEYIEKHCAQARVKNGHNMDYQQTDKLVAALYHHDLSRAEDPQLHTHSVIMNMTERSDGKWRSLASAINDYREKATGTVNGFIERVRHHNRYYSKLYETELAFQVKALGYEIRKDTPSGIFEIEGVSAEVIKSFSKRRIDIESKLEEKGLSGGKAAAMATLDTRQGKQSVNRSELSVKWQEDAKQFGLDCHLLIDQSYRRQEMLTSTDVLTNQKEKPTATLESGLQAIKQAAKSLSVFQSTFSLEEVVMSASDDAIKHHYHTDDLLKSVDHLLQSGSLIAITHSSGKTRLMTAETVSDEKRLFTLIDNNQSDQFTIIPSKIHQLMQNIRLDKTNLGELEKVFGQQKAILLEGEQAKQSLIDPIMKVSHAANLKVALLSPSLVGSKQFAHLHQRAPVSLWEKVKAVFVDMTPQHHSVAQFLSAFDEKNINSHSLPDILLVENSHLLSTKQQANLFEWNDLHGKKLILLGNQKTLLSQQHGVPIEKLAQHGLPTIRLAPQDKSMKHSVELGNLEQVIAKTVNSVLEISHEQDRYEAIVSHFCQLNNADRQQSWITANNKQHVHQLNILTHQALQLAGQLGKTTAVSTLLPVYIPAEKSSIATSYKQGQVVRFNESYRSLNVNRGEYLKVLRHGKVSNRVILQKENGDHIIWHPDKIAGHTAGKVELFDETKRDIAVNDLIMVQRSIRNVGLVKGERLSVTNIHKHYLKLKNQQGKSITLDLNKASHRHLDYSYAATPHQIAHEKPHTVIADLPTRSSQANQRHFYQLVSQPKEAWIYTNNKVELVDNLHKKSGDRLSVQEILYKSGDLKKSMNAFYDVLEKQITLNTPDQKKEVIQQAIQAVDYAMRHLSEREAGFTYQDLMAVAMNHAIGNVTQETLSKVTEQMKKEAVLVNGSGKHSALLTTIHAINMEKEIVSLSVRDRGTLSPILRKDQSEGIDWGTLKSEQINAIQAITNTTDRVLSIQGRAGTGKTTMMTKLADVLAGKEILLEQGYQLLCIAPTHKAVKELQSRGLAAQTVSSFLVEIAKSSPQQDQRDFSKTILIIDEASMVSSRNMLSVLKVGHELNFRLIVPTGDTKQNPAIESGKPHAIIKDTLNTTIYLEAIQRQKNDILKEAVRAVYQGDVAGTFSNLGNSLIEISPKTVRLPDDNKLKDIDISHKYYNKRIETIAKDYVNLLSSGEDVQIITPSHADRKAVNTAVRSLLSNKGTLTGKDHAFSILTSKDMTGVERSKSDNFQINQILRFSVSQSKDIKAGDYLYIQAINKSHNILTLSKGDGQPDILWQVPRTKDRLNNVVEVFQKEERLLKVGDKIAWTRTNKQEGMLSTYFAEVTQINENQVTVKQQDGQVLAFLADDKTYQHWDHGYAITSYGAQGGTYSTVLALFESSRKKLMNIKNLLVTITRPEHTLRLYTDDRQSLQKAIQDNSGDKTSSLEIIEQKPQPTTVSPVQTAKNSPSKTPSPTFAPPVNKPHFNRNDINKIKGALNNEVERIAIDTLGQPKERGGNYLKFGRNQGSLVVTTKGDKQGWFNDFETGQGGRDMLKFLELHGGMSREQALEYGAAKANLLPSDARNGLYKNAITNQKTTLKPSTKKSDLTFSDYEKKRIQLANKIAKESLDLKGTLAEKYLKEHRGVDLSITPQDIKFHPNLYCKKNQLSLPALIAIARNIGGGIQAVEAIYLDPKTANKANVPLSKQTIGPKKGAAVAINQANKTNAATLVAEGVVTGLSLAKSLPDTNVVITLGKQLFASMDTKQLSSKVVFCLDNDGKNLREDPLILRSADRLISHQKEVSFMFPTCLNMKKQDYNDVLKQQGVQRIQHDFQQAVSYRDFYANSANKADDLPATKINETIKQIIANPSKDQAYLKAYQQLNSGDQSQKIEKNMSQIRSLDREI